MNPALRDALKEKLIEELPVKLDRTRWLKEPQKRPTNVPGIFQAASVEPFRQTMGHSAPMTTIGYASALDEHKVDTVRKVFSSGDGRGLQSRREL